MTAPADVFARWICPTSKCEVALNLGAGDTFVVFVIRMARVDLLRRSSDQSGVTVDSKADVYTTARESCPWVCAPKNAITAFELP